MDKKLRDILACPNCHGPLRLHPNQAAWVCAAERLSFPIVDGIPHLLMQSASELPEYEIANWDPA
ncbi:MAG: Trm112 family protein [Betaproteobacteria bacterium]|nr:Trm112 family protein [Betaproteobacteria bacterium]NBT74823.1 Trm112 family protein [Betaproteobacteria bacterium]NBY13619.1 Trm112 family protein [Betaproteobacteria bacterium]NCA16309.1 Trm112 family protein [Betaproteobacteria bacterium]NDF04343.1 Trm112 family protein [Betaproteobacteria bacterium]